MTGLMSIKESYSILFQKKIITRFLLKYEWKNKCHRENYFKLLKDKRHCCSQLLSLVLLKKGRN